MSLVELQKFTAVSKYAKWEESKQRRETWPETVGRVRDMMLGKFPELREKIEWAYGGVERLEVLGSQRALQFGGQPILKKNERIYNCCASYCDRLRFFQEAFFLLLCGCGTGFSVQERHISSLPLFSAKRRAGIALPKKVFVIPDSIEGWADSMGVLLSSFHETPIPQFAEYHDCDVEFDFSLIRPKGSPLSFGIGKAPGPLPLMNALKMNRQLLTRTVNLGLQKLRSIDAYDFLMHQSDAVLAGGVRRSSAICLFDRWDKLMLSAKTGNWMEFDPQRARSNNSAMLFRGEVSFDEFQDLFQYTKEFGDPGFYWAAHPDALTNPCVEIGLYGRLRVLLKELGLFKGYSGPVIREGDSVLLSGWQFCNLSTMNGSTIKTEEDLYERCRMAATIGTLQASFTSFPYLGQVSEQITRKEALLGVSLSGVMHNPRLLLNPDIQRKASQIVMETNTELAHRIGINPAARWACVKPDGNSSTLMGSFSGHHAGKFRRGFRICQTNQNEAPYIHFRGINPEACEPSAWSVNGTDDVIRFCVEYEGVLEESLSAIQTLESVRGTYENWVNAGRVEERCVQPWLNHNVSNTTRVRDHEWNDVAAYIFEHQNSFTGVSFIGWNGDRDYPQAPFTSVFTPLEQERMYGPNIFMWASRLAQTWHAFKTLWVACDSTGEDLTEEQQKWFDQYKRMASYFGDRKKASYAIKDAYNWALWRKLQASYREVDYSQMVETTNGTKLNEEIACAGGACLI